MQGMSRGGDGEPGAEGEGPGMGTNGHHLIGDAAPGTHMHPDTASSSSSDGEEGGNGEGLAVGGAAGYTLLASEDPTPPTQPEEEEEEEEGADEAGALWAESEAIEAIAASMNVDRMLMRALSQPMPRLPRPDRTAATPAPQTAARGAAAAVEGEPEAALAGAPPVPLPVRSAAAAAVPDPSTLHVPDGDAAVIRDAMSSLRLPEPEWAAQMSDEAWSDLTKQLGLPAAAAGTGGDSTAAADN